MTVDYRSLCVTVPRGVPNHLIPAHTLGPPRKAGTGSYDPSSYSIRSPGGRNICARAENDLLLVWVSIDLLFVQVVEIDFVLACWPKLTWFWCEHRAWLVFSVGMGIYLVFVWGSKATWFQCLDRIWLGLCGVSNLTSCQCRDRNWLGFNMGRNIVGFSVGL